MNNKIENRKPTVISTFAGGGGSSLGYVNAGYEELSAIEYDKNAVETLKANFPELKVLDKSIADITVEEIFEITGLKKGELDILDGSPPCPGFSSSNTKRDPNDPRNKLYKEFVRLLEGLQPKVFVMENVTGMTKGKMKVWFDIITKTLKDAGYIVKCKKMVASYHNVPQRRERLIWIGIRKDLGVIPSYPEPNAKELTVKEVLPDIEMFTAGQFDRDIITSENPACTITKSPSFRIYENAIEREPTLSELKALCSFPEDYKFIGGKLQAWARMGNAVPPKMMEHIATHIKEKILPQISSLNEIKKGA